MLWQVLCTRLAGGALFEPTLTANSDVLSACLAFVSEFHIQSPTHARAHTHTELNLYADFEASGELCQRVWEEPKGPYDVVTCMFAMHYFFESELRLRMFLRNVSLNLKPGACVRVCVCVRVCACVCVRARVSSGG